VSNQRNQILTKWKSQLEDVKHILRYLKTYPQVLFELEIVNIVSPNELDKHLEAWVDLCLSYTGMEKDFFRPFWVPINLDDYDYFIDISDPNYPIFQIHYHCSDPHYYVRANLFDNINDLMLADDRNTDVSFLLEETKSSFYGFDF